MISFQGPVASASDVLLMLLDSENFETTEIPVLQYEISSIEINATTNSNKL